MAQSAFFSMRIRAVKQKEDVSLANGDWLSTHPLLSLGIESTLMQALPLYPSQNPSVRQLEHSA